MNYYELQTTIVVLKNLLNDENHTIDKLERTIKWQTHFLENHKGNKDILEQLIDELEKEQKTKGKENAD